MRPRSRAYCIPDVNPQLAPCYSMSPAPPAENVETPVARASRPAPLLFRQPLRAAAVALLFFAWLFGGVARLSAAVAIGATTVTPSTILVNTQTTITVTAQIANPNPLPNGVNLVLVGSSGPTLVGVLNDNGLNGDVTAGDGIYIYQFTVTPTALGAIAYEVTAAFGGVLQRVQASTLRERSSRRAIDSGWGTKPQRLLLRNVL